MANTERDPFLVVLSGPGGVGKGTLAKELVERDEELILSQSWTTRPRRNDENPEAYKFVSPEEFLQHRENNGFIEWNEFLGEFYGTPVPEDSISQDILLEIDVAGGRQILEKHSETVLIFLDAPDVSEQRRRLVERGDDAIQIEQRIEEGDRERKDAESLGYFKVVNNDLNQAVEQIQEIISDKRNS